METFTKSDLIIYLKKYYLDYFYNIEGKQHSYFIISHRLMEIADRHFIAYKTLTVHHLALSQYQCSTCYKIYDYILRNVSFIATALIKKLPLRIAIARESIWV